MKSVWDSPIVVLLFSKEMAFKKHPKQFIEVWLCCDLCTDHLSPLSSGFNYLHWWMPIHYCKQIIIHVFTVMMLPCHTRHMWNKFYFLFFIFFYQQEIDNVFKGGCLNLESVALLWNMCLGRYREQLETGSFLHSYFLWIINLIVRQWIFLALSFTSKKKSKIC